MKKRFWACFLSLSLVLTMMPTMAFAADDEVNEPGGTVEVCVETEGCTLEAGHEGECVVVESEPEEPESVPCKVTEGCTLDAGHEGECAVCEQEEILSTMLMTERTQENAIEVKSFTSGNLSEAIEQQLSEEQDTSTITSLKVSGGALDEDDFYYIRDNFPALISLDLSGATCVDNKIPDHAFFKLQNPTDLGKESAVGSGMTSLQTFVYPKEVVEIGLEAFRSCSGLTGTWSVPDTVTTLGIGAFASSGYTGALSIPSQIEVLPKRVFAGGKFSEVNLNQVEEIGEKAFINCSKLAGDLVIPSTVKKIGLSAFQGATSLTGTLILQGPVDLSDGSAFNGTKFTGTLELPNGIEEIGSLTFYGTAFESIEFNDDLKKIGNGAFQNTTNLVEITLPDSVTEIGESAFYNNASGRRLEKVQLGSNLQVVGKNAFQWQGDIKEIIYHGQTDLDLLTIFSYSISTVEKIDISNSGITKFTDNPSGRKYFTSLKILNAVGCSASIELSDYDNYDEVCLIFIDENHLSNITAPKAAVLNTNGGIFKDYAVIETDNLENPVRDGYIYEGWYADNSDSPTPVSCVEAGKTYYAKWAPSIYEVTSEVNFGAIYYDALDDVWKDIAVNLKSEQEVPIHPRKIEVEGSDPAIFATLVNEDNTITVTPHSNLSVGEYEETLYVTTPDHATFFVPVTLEVVPAGSELAIWANGAENLSLSGGGNVTLTITGDLNADEVKVTCDNENIKVIDNDNGTYSVTLPNETANYTFTAIYDGDKNHDAADATCTVSVTRHTGGGGASHPEASDDSSSNRNDRDDDDTENIDEEDVPLTEGKVADFDDVPADAWFAEAVQYVYEHDLMTGVSENLFAPNAQMNRAMVAQILFNVEKPADTEAPAAFRDVAADQWYAKAVNWAVWQGYMSGYGAGSFGPNDALTREQLVTVLWRYSGSPVMGDSSMLNTFSDAAMTSDYAQQAMTWAYAQGVISGNADGTLNPQGTATRAEVATILMRFYENMAE